MSEVKERMGNNSLPLTHLDPLHTVSPWPHPHPFPHCPNGCILATLDWPRGQLTICLKHPEPHSMQDYRNTHKDSSLPSPEMPQVRAKPTFDKISPFLCQILCFYHCITMALLLLFPVKEEICCESICPACQLV